MALTAPLKRRALGDECQVSFAHALSSSTRRPRLSKRTSGRGAVALPPPALFAASARAPGSPSARGAGTELHGQRDLRKTQLVANAVLQEPPVACTDAA